MIGSKTLDECIEKGVAKMEANRDWSTYSDREKRELAFLAGFHAAVNMFLDARKAELGIRN